MASFQLTLLFIVIALYSTFGGPIEDDEGLKPCPKIKPYTNVNTDQVKTKTSPMTNTCILICIICFSCWENGIWQLWL